MASHGRLSSFGSGGVESFPAPGRDPLYKVKCGAKLVGPYLGDAIWHMASELFNDLVLELDHHVWYAIPRIFDGWDSLQYSTRLKATTNRLGSILFRFCRSKMEDERLKSTANGRATTPNRSRRLVIPSPTWFREVLGGGRTAQSGVENLNGDREIIGSNPPPSGTTTGNRPFPLLFPA
ncbi:hypothetical protein DFP72DRAFT_854105 [Ephemerocybe angulata]|uniref:Uncharacterized protein n=1 Tax=Ephemerocybe angulata TaxID=980116 RepID=A0A8H6HIL5_9AGAR|nr:hypothetical protein DFP72DRAFT_854105 [Tulosesus angulatus]